MQGVRRNSAKRLLAGAGVIVLSGLVAGAVLAAASPPVSSDAALATRNIIESGDLYFLARFELPLQSSGFGTPVTTPEAWCAQLTDLTGCSGTTSDPEDPTSIRDQAAFVTLYSDTSATIVEAQITLQRVGHSLTGIYLPPGHGITWGDTNQRVCIESSPILFSPISKQCIPVTWNAAASDTGSQRDQLAADLVSQLEILEALSNLGKNFYIVNGKVTTNGTALALEALNVMPQIVPQAFQAASAQSIATAYATPSTGLASQNAIDATRTATGQAAQSAAASQELFGNNTMWGAFSAMLVGFGFAYGVFFVTGERVMSVVTMLTVEMVFMYNGWPTVSVVAVTAFLLSIIATWFVLQRRPQT